METKVRDGHYLSENAKQRKIGATSTKPRIACMCVCVCVCDCVRASFCFCIDPRRAQHQPTSDVARGWPEHLGQSLPWWVPRAEIMCGCVWVWVCGYGCAFMCACTQLSSSPQFFPAAVQFARIPCVVVRLLTLLWKHICNSVFVHYTPIPLIPLPAPNTPL